MQATTAQAQVLDADLLDGLQLMSSTTNNQANKVMRTDGNGYGNFGWINTASGATTSTLTRIYCSHDGYIRYQTPANFGASISQHITGFATFSGSNSFTNSYNEFGNNTGAVSNDGSWHARVNISGTSHARLDLFEDADNSKLQLYVHTGSGAVVGTTSSTALILRTAGTTRMTIPSNSGLVTTTGQGTLWGSSNDGSGSGLDADTL